MFLSSTHWVSVTTHKQLLMYSGKSLNILLVNLSYSNKLWVKFKLNEEDTDEGALADVYAKLLIVCAARYFQQLVWEFFVISMCR